MSRISVIIPCYKDAKTIQAAIDSVLAQTRMVDEIIVVNDCSPESEAIESIITQYPSVKYLKSNSNKGLAATRNIGIQASTCDILTFLDADDELHPQKIEFQLAVFSPEVAVTCRVRRTNFERGNEISVTYDKKFPTRIYSNSHELIKRNCLTGAAVMVSRDLLRGIGGYDEHLRSCEDFDLWLKILDTGTPVIDIQLPLYLYRLNLSGLSRNYPVISTWELKVVESYLRRHSDAFLASKSDALIWAYWLIKHIFRYEMSPSPQLKENTQHNIERLRAYPALCQSLKLIQQLRLIWPIAILLRLGRTIKA